MIHALILFLFAQFTVPSHTGALASAAPACTAPTMTYREPFYGAGNTCLGGTCTNGVKMTSVVDVVAGNNLTNTGGSSSPVYTTGQINGLAAGVYDGISQYMEVSTPIPASTVSMTYYAVVNVTGAAGAHAITGCTVSSGCIEWRVNGSHQELIDQGVAVIVSGTTTLTSGWHLLEMEYNASTGVVSLYVCSGGTCTLDVTATNVQAITADVSLIGAAVGVGDYWDSGIAEIGFINSVSSTTRSQIGAWGSCKFAL